MKCICGCPTGIVNIANDFYMAFERCREEKNAQLNEYGKTVSDVVTIPEIVNGAFALELYLKSMIPEKQRKSSGHSISVLYSVLSTEKQDYIKQRVEQKIKDSNLLIFDEVLKVQHLLTFDEAINGISKSFEYWRYIYEKEDLEFGFHDTLKVLPLFLDVIRELVLSNQKKRVELITRSFFLLELIMLYINHVSCSIRILR